MFNNYTGLYLYLCAIIDNCQLVHHIKPEDKRADVGGTDKISVHMRFCCCDWHCLFVFGVIFNILCMSFVVIVWLSCCLTTFIFMQTYNYLWIMLS